MITVQSLQLEIQYNRLTQQPTPQTSKRRVTAIKLRKYMILINKLRRGIN